MLFCEHRGGNRRPKGTSLAGTRDMHRATGHVCVDLHEQGIFLRNAPAANHTINWYSVFPDPLDDHAGAEGRGLDQGSVNIGTRGMKRLAEHGATEPRINENRAVAIVPVEGDKAALSGFLGGCFLSKPGVQTGISFAHDVDPPIKNIAYSRLARLNAVIAGQDRTFDDATN